MIVLVLAVIVQGFRVQQLGGWHVMRNRVGDHPVASTNTWGFNKERAVGCQVQSTMVTLIPIE